MAIQRGEEPCAGDALAIASAISRFSVLANVGDCVGYLLAIGGLLLAICG